SPRRLAEAHEEGMKTHRKMVARSVAPGILRTSRSAADAIRPAVEMQMVCVGSVVLGPEHAVEEAAGAVAHRAQKTGFGILARPVPRHRDTPPIGQHEARNVEGICRRMLA